jgi:hypothetical protein
MMSEDVKDVGAQIVAIADEIALYSGSPDCAISAIRPCIATLESSAWPEVAWSFSSLTQDGCPVEFAFSSCDNSLRYTTEVAGPELDNHGRLAAAWELIRKLQPKPALSEEFARWSSMQSGCPLRWGSWLGIREDASGCRLKVYVEIPKGAVQKSSIVEPLLPEGELLMMGHELFGGRTEYYFRQPEMSASQAASFQSRMADTESGRVLLNAFADLCAMPIAAALRWVPFGYSLICAPQSDEPVCTLFVRSRTLGKLARTRQHFLAQERSAKRESCYQFLLGDTADWELPDHGMLSLTVHRDFIEMRVSLSAIALARLRFMPSAMSEVKT